jgi:hypothetical protein
VAAANIRNLKTILKLYVSDVLWPGHLHKSGANPEIASYNASAVNIYNATSSLTRSENKNIFFYF